MNPPNGLSVSQSVNQSIKSLLLYTICTEGNLEVPDRASQQTGVGVWRHTPHSTRHKPHSTLHATATWPCD